MANPFSEEKLDQIVISFGCRTTPIRDVPSQNAHELCTKLKAEWPTLFENEVLEGNLEALSKPTRTFFAMQKSQYTKRGLAQLSTLQVHPDNTQIIIPRILNGEKLSIYKDDPWLTGGSNKNAASAILTIGNVLEFAPHRAGKIFNLRFAPIQPEEVQAHISRFLPETEGEPTDFKLQLTLERDDGGREYNIVVTIGSSIHQPVVTVTVDINNRDMSNSLNPTQCEQVFEYADRVMPSWVYSFLGGEDE